MLRPISTLPLSNPAILKLRKSGCQYIEDIENSEDLTKKYDLTSLKKVPTAISALDVWQEELQQDNVLMFSNVLDNILCGGIRCKEIIEICGAHGSGKSQICMQLCVATQLPKECGGLNSQCLYIDTRNSFSPIRVLDMIEGCQRRFPNVRLDAKEYLRGINVVSPRSLDDLLSVINSLKDLLTTDSKIRVLIIDSLSLTVQCSLSDGWKRTQLYFRIFDDLQKIAARNNVAVIVVNELRSHIDAKGKIGYISAGGQFVAHRANKRLALVRLNDFMFAAQMMKSSTLPQVSVMFTITDNGISDAKSTTNRRLK